ncbi:fibroblast growth factor receptor homolog 1-like isoform X2 [Chironomus tepperi]|uniref:fibroblast growth factor receptor homolog 1-like isoform X2 n=1 Tax=Chironomus tepperi TaxID=113505 RepID=UPI00391F0D09
MCNKSTFKIFLVLTVIAITQVHGKHTQNGFRRNRNSGKFHGDLDATHVINDSPDNDVDDEQIDPDKLLTTLLSSTTNSNVAKRSNIEPEDNQTEYAPYFTNKNALLNIVLRPSGNMIKLKCPAKGNPEPKWEWIKNGTPIERKLGHVQYNKMAITLEDLIPADSGNYTCIICNKLDCINFTSKVEVSERVNHAPIFKTVLTNKTVVIGENVTFEVEIHSDLHRSINWIKGVCADQEPNCNGTKFPVKHDDEQSETLRLENVTYADEGWYTCIAANSLGSTHASAYLQVVETLPPNPDITIVPHKPNELYGILVICLMFFFLLALIIIIFVWKKYTKTKKLQRQMERVNQWTKKVIVVQPCIDNGNPGISDSLQMPIVRIEKHRTAMAGNANDPNMISEYEFPIDLNWEFPRGQLELSKNLGEGAFGKVVMAEAHGLMRAGQITVVAVKMLKEGHTDEDVKDLVCEMEVMKMIGTHVNIINLLGCCSQDGPLYVIVEYAPHGNLRDFLRKHRPNAYTDTPHEKEKQALTQKDLVSFAFQIARGMEYLASRKCIHRDLAARNVLVSDDFVMKIADFGLARDIHSQDYYRKTTDGRLPVKWMSPESLFDKVYDTQSDVWSYGILLWEIMTLGGTPYPSVPSVKNLFEILKKGDRMEKPALCSIDIYMLMRECWHWNPVERPTFCEIVEDLDKILSITANEEYLDLGLPQLETPPSSSDEESDDDDTKEKFPHLL